jgi:hypothetical protein
MRTPARIFPLTGPGVHRIDARLLTALSLARDTARRAVVRAQALAELGDIELPDGAPTAADAQQLEVAAPLYLARELERAGVLKTAELVAGLFVSGAIMQPLGPTAKLIGEFWKTRQQRLTEAEREQLLTQAFEPRSFEPLMGALCDALVNQLVDPLHVADVQGQVAVQQAASSLSEWLAPRMQGMAAYAAHDILEALSKATHFLRDRMLQSAFGVHDLWGLIDVVGSGQGGSVGQARKWADLGQEGARVLTWVAQSVARGARFDPASPEGQQLMASAQGWRMDHSSLEVPAKQTTVAAAPVPVAA